METVVILGAGQVGRAARNLLNLNRLELVAIGDNNPAIWDYDAEVPVLPVAEALMADPDIVLIGVLDSERTGQLAGQAAELGYRGRIMRLSDVYTSFDLRGATFRRCAGRTGHLSGRLCLAAQRAVPRPASVSVRHRRWL